MIGCKYRSIVVMAVENRNSGRDIKMESRTVSHMDSETRCLLI